MRQRTTVDRNLSAHSRSCRSGPHGRLLAEGADIHFRNDFVAETNTRRVEPLIARVARQCQCQFNGSSDEEQRRQQCWRRKTRDVPLNHNVAIRSRRVTDTPRGRDGADAVDICAGREQIRIC